MTLLESVETEMVGRIEDLRSRAPGGEGLIGWIGTAIDEAVAEQAVNGRGARLR